VGDLYEVVLTIDVRADVTDDELTELRWHVGQAPRPERFPFGTDNYLDTFPLGDPADPGCEWETAEPEPLFAERGGASAVGGALVADLAERKGPDGWALTVRQELHPDSFYALRSVLAWLGPAAAHARTADVPFFAGYLRFHEDVDVVPLVLLNGRIGLPEAIEEHTPHWQGA
jgi:hypothetical protein